MKEVLSYNSTVTSHVKKKEEGSRQKDPIETQLLTRGLQATHELGELNVEVQNQTQPKA